MDVFDEIEARVLAELAAAGPEMVDDFRGRIGTSYPPSSVPGEYPHRRTGNLQNETGYRIESRLSVFGLTVFNNAPYAFRLKATGRRMLEYLAPDWIPRLADRLQAAAHGRSAR